MARKVRSDIKVGNLEKKLGVSPGTITNADGSDARSDKKLGTLRKEYLYCRKHPEEKEQKLDEMISTVGRYEYFTDWNQWIETTKPTEAKQKTRGSRKKTK